MKTLFEAPNAKEPNQAWCVYSHFDVDGDVQAYVIEALKRIKASGLKIVVMSTSPSMSEAGLQAMSEYATTVVLRDNIGYDFGSYKLGIEYLKEIKAKPHQLLITNDSVFGPFQSLKPILKKAKNFDVYGLTDSIDINYHLQSYFLVYGEKVLKSRAFTEFWNSVELFDTNDKSFKQKIINDYEVGGSQYFLKKKFTLGAAYGFKTLAQSAWSKFIKQIDSAQTEPGFKVKYFNPGNNTTHFYWRDLIQKKFPYIKRELVTTNPANQDVHDWPTVIGENTNYPTTKLIDAVFQFNKNNDFLFTTSEVNTWAQKLNTDGQVEIKLNRHFEQYAKQLRAKQKRRFVFDEDYYLELNGDVKQSVKEGKNKSGLSHFKMLGYTEFRAFKLKNIGN